jgi:hypothetical protein
MFEENHVSHSLLGWSLLAAFLAINLHVVSVRGAQVRMKVVDKTTANPLPCRVHVQDANGKPVKTKKFPYWADHFVCPGRATLDLPAGAYRYEVERGPEYRAAKGQFTSDSEPQDLSVELERLVDLSAQGWWAGDLHIHRPLGQVELLMSAEDLHVAPIITWWNEKNEWAGRTLPTDPLVRFDGNRFYHVMAGEDERGGGALLYFNAAAPLPITGSSVEYPPAVKFLDQARQKESIHIDIEKPFWWDVPVWLATGRIDTIGLANNHMCRSEMHEDEAWGRPRDKARLRPPLGNGYWTQELYYHVLNCGLRIAPSAGSASGVLNNPVGYNRVYVHVDGEFSYAKWWEGLRAGRSFVTNGPLLRVQVNDKLPGAIFKSADTKPLELNARIELTSRDPIHAIEVIRNGRIDQVITPSASEENKVAAQLKFAESGWFLVRVLAENAKTFRFASTAPYFVEIGPNPRRISRASVQFFLDWLAEREKLLKLGPPDQRREVLASYATARAYWSSLLKTATTD